MPWKIKYLPPAVKDLKKIDCQMKKRLRSYLEDRIAKLDDPRDAGTALKGRRLEGLWRYRLGDYRIICDFKENELVILALKIGHRKSVYED